jgi:hypothetical protein
LPSPSLNRIESGAVVPRRLPVRRLPRGHARAVQLVDLFEGDAPRLGDEEKDVDEGGNETAEEYEEDTGKGIRLAGR